MENNPCFLCQKDNKQCDFQRPCAECKKRGTPHMCMGIEIEARSQRHYENQRLAREKAYASVAGPPPLAVPVGVGANIAAASRQTPIPIATPAASASLPSGGIDVPPLPVPKLNKKKRKRLPNEIPLANTAPGLTPTDLAGRAYVPASVGIPPPQPAAVPAAGQPAGNEEQMKINYFLLSELRKTKEEQSKMARELQVVKLENHKLHTRMAQAAEGYRLLQMAFRQMHPNYGLSPGAIKLPHTVEAIGAAPNSPIQALTTTTSNNNPLPAQVSQDKAFAGWMSEKAMVVFDLSKNPAVVLTCNDAFCQLFGYSMENVIGMAWKKFIHPSYFERTMTILLQNNGAGNQQQASIQFVQVYKSATGSTFVSLDTHTFFYGTSGPRADLVTITPVSSALPETTDLFFWPVTETASPLPTSPRPIVSSPHSPHASSSSAAAAAAASASSSYDTHHSLGSVSTTAAIPGGIAQAVDDGFETVPPPVRRRKKSLNDTGGGPTFVQVEELAAPEEIYRNATVAAGNHANTTLPAPNAAKPRKPRQPKAKQNAAAATTATGNSSVVVRRAGTGGAKSRRSDAANRDLQSQVRIEEIPVDEITVPTFPPDIQVTTPHPDDVLAATAAAIAAEQQQQQQQQQQAQMPVDTMSVDAQQISPGQDAALFSDPEIHAMFGLPANNMFDSGSQDLSSVGLDNNVGGEQLDSFFASDLPY